MRKRYDFFIDVAQFPLVTLLIAVILLGTGNILVNPSTAILWKPTNHYVILASACLRMFGGAIVMLFPLSVLIALLNKRFEEVFASLIGVISYIVILITTMFFASDKLPADAYSSMLGIGTGVLESSRVMGVVRYPLQLGILASFICYVLTKHCFERTRNRKTYGLFSFIDKNTMALLLVIVYSFAAGIAISYVWKYFILGLYQVFAFIADDITNPFNLFLYGVIEKLMALLNMVHIPRNAFWFTELGGSWLDSLGRKYVGDVAIWTAQITSGSIARGTGRFITPNYMIQMFALPGYIVALFTLVSNRFEKRKYISFMVIAIVASILCGNALPFELFMFCASPLLFFFHVGISGMLYAVFEWAKIFIGFSYTGSALFASVGSLADLLVYFKSATMIGSLSFILILGVVIFGLYFLATRIYYRYLAIDMFQVGKEKQLVEQLVDCLGGIENIKIVDRNIFKLLVQVKSDQIVDVMRLRKLCFSKVFESKTGYVLYFYKASPKLYDSIKVQMKEYEDYQRRGGPNLR